MSYLMGIQLSSLTKGQSIMLIAFFYSIYFVLSQ